MSNLKPYFFEFTKATKTNVYIETGCWLGGGIDRVVDYYDVVHGIELSDRYYNIIKERFKDNKKVIVHHGDSKKILPLVLQDIHEPVTIYLDAHWSGGDTAYGEEETPLLQELALLKERKYDDIIIIDDCRLFGLKGQEHDVNYNWRHITKTRIKNEFMKDGYVILKNTGYEFTYHEHNDQYILVRMSRV